MEKTFLKDLGEYKPDILNYYPYGKETTWNYWLTGEINLKEYYKDERCKNKTEQDLVLSIIEEVARAMSYLVIRGEDSDGEFASWFYKQKLNAFTLWGLFHNGIAGWNKEITNGKSVKEIEELEEINRKKSQRIYGINRHDKELLMNKRYIKSLKESKLHNRKEYGVYVVTHLPLTQYSNGTRGAPKILYTKQQLAAIDIIVACAFENLC